MQGKCLCGQVAFEILGAIPKLYQCHCSLCRKQGGSASNTATIVPSDKFRWLRGTERLASWIKDTGFRSDFCSTCGSPVPNPLRDTPYVWIPAGLLEDGENLEIVTHLCLSSRAPWDSTIAKGICHDELPNLPDLIASLQPSEP